jgi:hypothetical protein
MPKTKCPNGTRKNKKTGVCEGIQKTTTLKTKEPKKAREPRKTKEPKNSEAKIVDVANLVDKNYDGYVSDKMLKNGWEDKLNRFIQVKKNKFQEGDIIFVGSTYETRQEYGFRKIYKKDNQFKTLENQNGFDLITKSPGLVPFHQYSKALNTLKQNYLKPVDEYDDDDKHFAVLFFGGDPYLSEQDLDEMITPSSTS